jgi:hypothetical protein
MQGIRVEVDNDGRTKMLYEGFKGDLCFKEAERLLAGLKALGVDVDVEKVKRTEAFVEAKEAVKNGC